MLLSESKLTKNEFYKSRNKLKQFGLIDFKERGGNKLKYRLGEKTYICIERLSNYIASSGKQYKLHYVTILTWVEKDKQIEKLGGGNYAGKGQRHPKQLCTKYPE